MTDKLRQAIEQVVAILGPEAPLCSGCVDEWTEALRILNDALAQQPAEPQDPVAYNGWVLREVLFDNGEPVGHREPTKAEPQEPVAWCHLQYNEDGTYFADCLQYYPDSYGNTPLYTAPQPAKPAEQEPVAYMHCPSVAMDGKVRPVLSFEKYEGDYASGIYSVRIPLYAAPPAPEARKPAKREPLPPASPCALTEAEYRIFKLGWLECESAHGIGEQE